MQPSVQISKKPLVAMIGDISLAMATFGVSAQATPIKVFIMGGQSNMLGRANTAGT